MVQNLEVHGGVVTFDYVLTTPAALEGPHAARGRGSGQKVPRRQGRQIKMTANVKASAQLSNILGPGIKNVIAVGSGKGGVGKSTSPATSRCLWPRGAKVGLMDADVYGPNQPQMMGVGLSSHVNKDNKMEPPTAFGVKIMSMGS